MPAKWLTIRRRSAGRCERTRRVGASPVSLTAPGWRVRPACVPYGCLVELADPAHVDERSRSRKIDAKVLGIGSPAIAGSRKASHPR
jgi:hypothetical protein